MTEGIKYGLPKGPNRGNRTDSFGNKTANVRDLLLGATCVNIHVI